MSKEEIQTKQKILAAAQRMFFENGYDKTSIHAIIEKVGVAKGTFYHHFNSKEELMEELVKGFAAEIEKGISSVLDEKMGAVEKLNAVARRGGELKKERAAFIRMYSEFMANPDNCRMTRRIMDISREITVPIYEKIISQGIEEGVFDCSGPGFTAEILFGLGESMQRRIIPLIIKDNPGKEDLAAIIKDLNAYERVMERIIGAPEKSLKFAEETDIKVFLKK